MTDRSAPYLHLLEPSAFAHLFMDHPPRSFECHHSMAGLPVFFTKFDLLTTLDKSTRNALSRLPLFKHWSSLFQLSSCFCGTSITEYAPLPRHTSAENLASSIIKEHAGKQSLLIIKDLPSSSPLLSHADNEFSNEFMEEAESRGFINVQGQALAYVPIDFANEEEYLARLSPSRRYDLRRKLRKKTELSIEIKPLGDALFFNPAFLEKAYAMYLDVFRQSDIHFDLLSYDFFATLLQSNSISGVVFLYSHEGVLAGYNICLTHNSVLIDKYIGFNYSLVRKLNLYFVSWMVNLSYARENGFSTYIAGWTDPEVKASLGAKFTFTRHLVWVRNPILRRILHRLRHLFEADSRAIENKS